MYEKTVEGKTIMKKDHACEAAVLSQHVAKLLLQMQMKSNAKNIPNK